MPRNQTPPKRPTKRTAKAVAALDDKRTPHGRAAASRRRGPAPDAGEQQTMPSSPVVVEHLAVGSVRPDPKNVRRDIGDVTELAESVREHGVLEPLLVTVHGKGWMVVCGHRRLAAAKLAGSTTVPCIVRTFAPQARLETQLTENLDRLDLTPLEEAHAYSRMLDYVSQHQLSKRVNRSQSHISKRMALLKLPPKVQTQIEDGDLALGDALELAKLADDPKLVDEALKIRRSNQYDDWSDIVADVKDAADGRAKQTEEIAKLKAEGITIIPWPRAGWFASKAKPIKSKTPATSRYYYIAVAVPLADVRKNGHLAAAVNDQGDVLYLCTDPGPYLKAKATKTAGPTKDELTAEAAEAKAERSRKLDEGKQRRQAARDRLPYLRKIVLDDDWNNPRQPRDVGAAVGGIVSMQLAVATNQVHDVRIACELLELDYDKGSYGSEHSAVTERAVVSPSTVGAALGLATIERQLRDGSGPWNKVDRIQRRNFYFLLDAVGYEPSTPWESKLVADVRADARRAG